MRGFRWLLGLLLVLLLLVLAVPAALLVALNSQAGRDFAARQIAQRSGGEVRLTGIGGHFPADLKLAGIEIADAKGVWLTGTRLELRWRPAELLARRVHVVSLSADALAIARAPSGGKPAAKSAGPPDLHHFTAAIDRLRIGQLGLGAALAGQPVALAITGKATLASLSRGSADLSAVADAGRGVYRLAATLDDDRSEIALHVAEPPDGLLGHYAGRQAQAPLRLDLHLSGPRRAAALDFSAALGAAELTGSGILGLDPAAPRADITFDLPALAPFARFAGQQIAGATQLHLVVAPHSGAADIALEGHLSLTRAPGPAAKLIGRDARLSLRLRLAHDTAEIQHLAVNGAGFEATAAGRLSQSALALKLHLDLDDVAALSPTISGHVTDDDVIAGTPRDFALHASLSGTIKEKSIPSGPFALTLDAQHLPRAPSGTLQGRGALENASLALDAAFSRGAGGDATLKIARATWRSVDLTADLALAAGAALPTGQAKFAIARLADLAAFSPVKLQGSVQGNFTHHNPRDFGLNLNARKVVISPKLGAIDAKASVNGPLSGLAVRLNLSLSRLQDAPLQLAATGTLNADDRSVSLASFHAGWKQLDLALLGPARFETRPGLAVRHLALALNGGRLTLDGRLTPRLDLELRLSDLPASLASLASPGLALSGSLNATARLSGSARAPAGQITVSAAGIKLHSGTAEALPPADLNARMDLAGGSGNLDAILQAGPDADLRLAGLLPLRRDGAMRLHLAGMLDLHLLDPILAARGAAISGILTPDFTVTGSLDTPDAAGGLSLQKGSLQDIGSGLNLQAISARVRAANRMITLENFSAVAGQGSITGQGSVDLGQPAMPVTFRLDAANASPVSSDLVTENLDAALALTGAVRGGMKLAGRIEIDKADINLPKSLPASVANLPIYRAGEKPPPPPAPPPAIALALTIHARNQIFIRGDGLFAELGGRLGIGGTAADPIPDGGFTLIRGSFALGGRTLQFTKGVVSFNGAGFMPTLDLEATTTTTNNTTATLIVGGTAAKPTITLTSSPPLPSDEILSQLLFGQSTSSLSPFQAASLAAALASLSGIGGSAVSDPLGGVRNALGLDELSLGGGTSGGAPSLQAGRYVAPGVFVGAQQSTSGSGTQATVQIDLYHGLKLQTQTGTGGSGGSGNSSSVGLTYQFNY